VSDSSSSYRQILKSTSIIGGASVINILIGLLRIKVVAVVLGPSGVGLVALLQQVMTTASTIAGMGMSSAGTRQIAEAVGREDQVNIAAARRALLWATMLLSLVGAVFLWLFRVPLSSLILNDVNKADLVGWLAVGVALSVAAGSQTALLNGLRRIGDLAMITVLSALVATLVAVPAMLVWGEKSIIVLVLATPITSFIFGHLYVARLPRDHATPLTIVDLTPQWSALVKLGMALMLASLVTVGGQLIVSTMVNKELGAESLGYFSASWTISVTYISFVLGAMGTDYYPRLTAAIHDKAAANKLVNEQTEVALLLAGPVLIAMMGLAPWIIELLYAQAFAPAAEILRWQIMGNILKIISWPLGFILLASAAGKTFILTESIGIGVFVLGVALGLPVFGVTATGMAFIALYLIYLPLVWWLGGRLIGFRWSRAVIFQAMLVISTALLVACIANWSELAAVVVSLAVTMILSALALIRLTTVSNVSGRLAMLARMGERVRAWILVKTP
jgi:PST family polysaccharide transporter